MAAMEPLCSLFKIDYRKLPKSEFLILEAELFLRICHELTKYFENKFFDNSIDMSSTLLMEKEMLEVNFTRLIIKDILRTDEYTVEGLAKYTGIHTDIIHDVISGLNHNPSAILLQRAIEIHRTIRQELYKNVVQKILLDHNDYVPDA